jgi:hypothetical protein
MIDDMSGPTVKMKTQVFLAVLIDASLVLLLSNVFFFLPIFFSL